jgi:hypothetical protein
MKKQFTTQRTALSIGASALGWLVVKGRQNQEKGCLGEGIVLPDVIAE